MLSAHVRPLCESPLRPLVVEHFVVLAGGQADVGTCGRECGRAGRCARVRVCARARGWARGARAGRCARVRSGRRRAGGLVRAGVRTACVPACLHIHESYARHAHGTALSLVALCIHYVCVLCSRHRMQSPSYICATSRCFSPHQ